MNGVQDLREIYPQLPQFAFDAHGFAVRQACRASSVVIAVTPGIARWLENHWSIPPQRIHVIPNGVSPRLFKPLSQSACQASLGLAG